MLMIKLMSGEDLPDGDTSKSFESIILGPGWCYEFYRQPGVLPTDRTLPVLRVVNPSNEVVLAKVLQGNAYVVSETGRTIGSFAHTLTVKP